MSFPTALGLIVIAIVAAAVLLFGKGGAMRPALCPQPVYVHSSVVSCNGVMPTPDPSPAVAR